MSRVTPFPLVIVALSLAAAVPAVAGPELKKSQVLSTVREAMPNVLSCGPTLDETVNAKWTITGDGEVVGVKIEGKHAKTEVGKCMKKHLSAMRFGHSVKSTPVKFPFRFGASSKAQPTSTQGKLARKDLDGLLKILEDDLKKCGEGTVRAKFVIKPTGRPDDVVVHDTDEKTSDCITRRIARVRFPTASKPTPVERNFALAADEG